ncbi:C1 family peptidase [Raoultella ornithinolytica]|uniref:C1 family peptidase n=1 Tax=Raoultella ornithinolytica TaxID=54291 RepID=UPI002904364E|nr:C1 family peptidase [Raoultella ornithinolytica]MDU0919638.1 C1 family peptidase [Raoultella ornithinolytica]
MPTKKNNPNINTNTVSIGGRNYLTQLKPGSKNPRVLDILPDQPDIRDTLFQPNLRVLRPEIKPTLSFTIRDQGRNNSCVGFALGHYIDILMSANNDLINNRVSARMLYEMAKANDEWAESPHEGSSLRGGLKGFYRNGVCKESSAPANKKSWTLTYELAKEAREIRLGAYYRLLPELSHYHAALNDIGAIYISAQIHSNWYVVKNGSIIPGGEPFGGHAFVIVGYDKTGFLILNTWGEEWGDKGIAHWDYKDWADTVMDAWVLQLGVNAPSAFDAIPRMFTNAPSGLFGLSSPTRDEILGHFINIDDGKLKTTGKYFSPVGLEIEETAKRLLSPTSNKGDGFDHLVIYAHGGLNSEEAEAKRIAKWKRSGIFDGNGIYNFHLMWASDFIGEVFGGISAASDIAGVSFSDDFMYETGPVKAAGSRAWRNMKGDAQAAFSGDPDYDGGYRGLLPLLKKLDQARVKKIKIHLVGHSAGSIVLGRLLTTFGRFELNTLCIESIHLMAPACTVDFFNEHYQPLLTDKGSIKLNDKIYLYMMQDDLEYKDIVGLPSVPWPKYRHSLLYLVSRAFEERKNMPLAGMEIYKSGMPKGNNLIIYHSQSNETKSTSHGGFDNDLSTMTTILKCIKGGALSHPPREDDMTGY